MKEIVSDSSDQTTIVPDLATTRSDSSIDTNTKDTMSKKSQPPMALIVFFVAIASGAATGFGIHSLSANEQLSPEIQNIQEGSPTSDVKVGDVYGSKDETLFKDSAEGVLQLGGLDGEGSHKILREGGPTQTVYVTSSVVDLDKFEGARVKVWGETQKAQKVGWLMDVGRASVLELNAQPPIEPTAAESKSTKKR